MTRCKNCGDDVRHPYITGPVRWKLCPSCRWAYGKGAFWMAIIIGIAKGIFAAVQFWKG
jgi:hypothetical protein